DDRIQNRGWSIFLVKPLEGGDPKEILLANLPYNTKKAFESWQANRSPDPALKKLQAELAVRRTDYIAAVNSGAPDQVEVATRNLEATKDQIARMQDLSAEDAKDEGITVEARPTGQTYENLEIWDCSSQKEFDAAYAVALKARIEQDER